MGIQRPADDQRHRCGDYFLLSIGDHLQPLFCLAISSKRYVLFNRDADGRIVLRSRSDHGLGVYLDPTGEVATTNMTISMNLPSPYFGGGVASPQVQGEHAPAKSDD